VTEDEAKTKWCPFARTVQFDVIDAGVSSPRNRVQNTKGSNAGTLYADTLAGVKCIASACMAWRWVQDASYRAAADREFQRTGRRLAPSEGFCGLAGAPR
jgi:hypothetical protein